MRKIKLHTIWKDSVGSKVISVGVVAIIATAYNFITAKLNGISFSSAFKNFWTLKIDLWILLLLTIIGFILYFLINPRFKYDEQTLSLDRELFKQIRENQAINDLFIDIKSNCFSSCPIEGDKLTTMLQLMEKNKRADFQFLNPWLEKLKAKLMRDIDNLESALSGNIYGTNNSGWRSIPSEWEFTQPERMRKAIRDIEKQEKTVALSFQKFITEGRKVLKV